MLEERSFLSVLMVREGSLTRSVLEYWVLALLPGGAVGLLKPSTRCSHFRNASWRPIVYYIRACGGFPTNSPRLQSVTRPVPEVSGASSYHSARAHSH